MYEAFGIGLISAPSPPPLHPTRTAASSAWSLVALVNTVTSLALVWASSIVRWETVVISVAIEVLSVIVALDNWVIVSMVSR